MFEKQLTNPYTVLWLHVSFTVSPGYISYCCASFPTPGWPSFALTHTHNPQRWKEKSSSITSITASCSDQLTTTKCPRKSIFSPRDLSAVLTSNFIFIDHRLFTSIWSVAARRVFDILPCTIKVDNMPLWQKSKSMFSWIHPAFERFILLWKVYIYAVSSVGKELMGRSCDRSNYKECVTLSRPHCSGKVIKPRHVWTSAHGPVHVHLLDEQAEPLPCGCSYCKLW